MLCLIWRGSGACRCFFLYQPLHCSALDTSRPWTSKRFVPDLARGLQRGCELGCALHRSPAWPLGETVGCLEQTAARMVMRNDGAMAQPLPPRPTALPPHAT